MSLQLTGFNGSQVGATPFAAGLVGDPRGVGAANCCGGTADRVTFSRDALGLCAQGNMGMEALSMSWTARLMQFLMSLLQRFMQGGLPNAGGLTGGMPGIGAPGSGAANAPDLDAIRGGTAFGSSLAKDAFANANGPGGWCFRWVSQALRRHGVNTSGASAYMAADQLAKSNKFQEVKGLSRNDLRQLPPGAVVVWHHAPGQPHGHISIADGRGNEASDKIRKQTTTYPSTFRVFLPR